MQSTFYTGTGCLYLLCIQCDRRAVFDAGGVQDKVRFHRSDGVGNFKHEYCCIPDPWISDCVCQPLSDEKRNREFGIYLILGMKKAILQRFFSVRRSWSEQSR